jgi:hypothetical protein
MDFRQVTLRRTVTAWQDPARLDRQNGMPMDLNPGALPQALEELITDLIRRLEFEKELESGVVPSWTAPARPRRRRKPPSRLLHCFDGTAWRPLAVLGDP